MAYSIKFAGGALSIIVGISTPTLNPKYNLNPNTQRHHNRTFTRTLRIREASVWGNGDLFKFL